MLYEHPLHNEQLYEQYNEPPAQVLASLEIFFGLQRLVAQGILHENDEENWTH